jgi:type I restriction enzyme M protein
VLFFDKKAGVPGAHRTSALWVYDFRTGQHFTLKQNRLTREHLDDFVKCYRPGEPRGSRIETERFKPFSYDELIARDKVSLDITWLKDQSLEDADSLLPPDVIAREIVEDLTAALAEFTAISEALEQADNRPSAE